MSFNNKSTALISDEWDKEAKKRRVKISNIKEKFRVDLGKVPPSEFEEFCQQVQDLATCIKWFLVIDEELKKRYGII